MSCSHLNNLLLESGTDSYRTIHTSLVSPYSVQALERKAKSSICLLCHSHGPRMHACLHCIYLGCAKDSEGNHRDIHSRQKSHPCSVELSYGNVYCFDCGDYVYHADLEAISEAAFDKAAKNLSLCGRGGVRYTPWRPSPQEVSLLKIHRKRKGFSPSSTVGLRGLINLGNTCFMSCIVQTLIHTPLLRDYFLSDRHDCFFQGDKDQCIVCEVSRLFQEFYSGAKSPLVPHVLLHMTWQQAHHLAGYEQQDAHEFLIATLNLLHAHLTRRGPGDDNNRSSTNCDCIVDTIFKGRLQSDVVCQACQNVSTTIEPFYDISLDLPTVLPPGQPGPISIQDCLERFTKPEYLGSASKIKCSTCLSYQESTKQLTMRQLPIVASFHLKRFEHSSRLHKKISTRIAYPEVLDLSPFISHKRNNASHSEDSLPMRENKYTLFAVINHIGNIEAGHYTSFIRQHRDKWFRCNDHQIYPTTIAEVLDSEGYLLFYHKQILEYH